MKKLTILMLTVVLLFSLVGCIDNYDEYETNSFGSFEDEYGIEQNNIVQEEKPELPDSLYFMRNFDYIKNDDDTYSFVGYITGCEMGTYGPTTYITTSNGEGYSTSRTGEFERTYIGKNGEISSILNDMLFNFSNLQGIPFTFVYDADGALIDIIPSEPYRYNHYTN